MWLRRFWGEERRDLWRTELLGRGGRAARFEVGGGFLRAHRARSCRESRGDGRSLRTKRDRPLEGEETGGPGRWIAGIT